MFACLACENIHFSSLFAAGDVSHWGASATQWQKFHTDDQDLSAIWSEALIGRRSSYIVLAIVYDWQTKDKRPHRSNVNTKSLQQNSQYLWNIAFSRSRSIEFCWRWLADKHNTLPKSTRRHVKLDKFIFGTPWLPNILCKHWFASSVWNFCLWVADFPPRETSLATKSEEKRMFLQATACLARRK